MTEHHGEITRVELQDMRDPIARFTWEMWIAEGNATLVKEET